MVTALVWLGIVLGISAVALVVGLHEGRLDGLFTLPWAGPNLTAEPG